jgi:hypothetical protein
MGPRARESNAQNEPNFEQPDRNPEANCAKQSQTWEGWGIWGTARQGGLLCETKPIVQNEPNFARAPGNGRRRSGQPRAKRAKRTQLDPASPGSGWGKDAKRTQFPAERGCTGPQGRGTRGQLCKMNPIPGGWPAGGTPIFHDSIIPPFQSDANCAKRTQFGPVWEPRPWKYAKKSGGDAQPTKRRMCKTNPICRLPSRCDGETDCPFPSPRSASILDGHRQPKNRDGKG